MPEGFPRPSAGLRVRYRGGSRSGPAKPGPPGPTAGNVPGRRIGAVPQHEGGPDSGPTPPAGNPRHGVDQSQGRPRIMPVGRGGCEPPGECRGLRSGHGVCSRSWPDPSDSARCGSPKNGPHRGAVQDYPGGLELAASAQPLDQLLVDPRPEAGGGPFAQPPPAGNPAAATHLGRDQPPRHAGAKHVHDARQTGPVGNPGTTALRFGRLGRQKGLDLAPESIGNQVECHDLAFTLSMTFLLSAGRRAL